MNSLWSFVLDPLEITLHTRLSLTYPDEYDNPKSSFPSHELLVKMRFNHKEPSVEGNGGYDMQGRGYCYCQCKCSNLASHTSGSIGYSYDPFLCCKGDCDEGQVEDCYNQVADREVKEKECGAISKSGSSMDECVDADEEVCYQREEEDQCSECCNSWSHYVFTDPPIAGGEVDRCRILHRHIFLSIHVNSCYTCTHNIINYDENAHAHWRNRSYLTTCTAVSPNYFNFVILYSSL